MTKVFDRILKCPLSAYIGAMEIMVEKESIVSIAKKLELCCNLKSMAKRLRGWRSLSAVDVVAPKEWGGPKVNALKVQLQQQLCEDRGTRAVKVKISGRHE